jgi:hypothetical protein
MPDSPRGQLECVLVSKVLMTMVGGRIVYQDPSWEGEQSAGSKQKGFSAFRVFAEVLHEAESLAESRLNLM